MKYKVGDIIVSASSDSYVGEIIHISKEEDVVRHRCRKTGTEYEKSYFGFQCRYMTVEERLEKDQEFCTENIQLHQQILTMEREHNDALTTSKERRESIDALTAQLARREREHEALKTEIEMLRGVGCREVTADELAALAADEYREAFNRIAESGFDHARKAAYQRQFQESDFIITDRMVVYGPGEGRWSVFAMKVVEERNELRHRLAGEAAHIKSLEGLLVDAARERDEALAQVARREREHEALLETAQKALAHVEAERDDLRHRLAGESAHIKSLEGLLVEATTKADAYERDWYEAKSEFGTAAAKLRDQVRTLEAALTTETRVALDYQKQRDEARRDLGEILAVIHRDGGHYTGERGISKSVADAHATWAVMVRERDEARAEVEVLRRERDDLHGAVMLAEERGAEWAIRAKAQVVYSLAGDASYVMLAKEVCEQARGKR